MHANNLPLPPHLCHRRLYPYTRQCTRIKNITNNEIYEGNNGDDGERRLKCF